jgi:glutamate-ammonia-ligase adenylyltransferase
MAELERRCSASEDPDSALGRFHDFLAGLTVGVRCLSLLLANPALLELLSEITMTAPALAGRFATRPSSCKRPP